MHASLQSSEVTVEPAGASDATKNGLVLRHAQGHTTEGKVP